MFKIIKNIIHTAREQERLEKLLYERVADKVEKGTSVIGQIKQLEEQCDKAEDIVRDLYFIIMSRIDYDNNVSIKDAMNRAKHFLIQRGGL